MGLPRAERYARSTRLIAAGLGMVLTGLVGQFHETSGGSAYTIWAVVSTIFYAWLLVEIHGVTSSAAARLGPLAHWPRRLFAVMAAVWTIYVVGSVATFVLPDGNGIWLRQGLFTLADIASKLVYGVILGRFLLRLSAAEGDRGAIEALGELPGSVAAAVGSAVGSAARSIDPDRRHP